MTKLMNLLIGTTLFASFSLGVQAKSEILSCFDQDRDSALLKKLESHMDDFYIIKVKSFYNSDFQNYWFTTSCMDSRLELVHKKLTGRPDTDSRMTLDGEINKKGLRVTSTIKSVGSLIVENDFCDYVLEKNEIMAGKNSWRISISELLKGTNGKYTKSELLVKLIDPESGADDTLSMMKINTQETCDQLKDYLSGSSILSKRSDELSWKFTSDGEPAHAEMTYDTFFIKHNHPWLK